MGSRCRPTPGSRCAGAQALPQSRPPRSCGVAFRGLRRRHSPALQGCRQSIPHAGQPRPGQLTPHLPTHSPSSSRDHCRVPWCATGGSRSRAPSLRRSATSRTGHSPGVSLGFAHLHAAHPFAVSPPAPCDDLLSAGRQCGGAETVARWHQVIRWLEGGFIRRASGWEPQLWGQLQLGVSPSIPACNALKPLATLHSLTPTPRLSPVGAWCAASNRRRSRLVRPSRRSTSTARSSSQVGPVGVGVGVRCQRVCVRSSLY